MAETEKQQELYHVNCAQLILSYAVQDPSPGTGLPTFKMSPPISVNLIKTIPHYHGQGLT